MAGGDGPAHATNIVPSAIARALLTKKRRFDALADRYCAAAFLDNVNVGYHGSGGTMGAGGSRAASQISSGCETGSTRARRLAGFLGVRNGRGLQEHRCVPEIWFQCHNSYSSSSTRTPTDITRLMQHHVVDTSTS